MDARARKLLGGVARVVVGAGVFAFVVLRKPAELGDALRAADLSWVVLAFVALVAGLLVSALRWRAYLEALEIPLPAAALVRLYFVGTFFNAFLPTGVGGDAYKALRLARAGSSGSRAFASVFLDRFAGVIGLAIIGLFGVVFELFAGDQDLRVAVVAVLLSGGILIAALILFVGGERLLGGGRFIKHHGWGDAVRRAMRAVQEAGRHPHAAARGYLLGVLFQGLVLIMHAFLARALGLSGLAIGAMAGVVVISSMAALIPVTVNGLGFREAAYVWALGTFGVAHAQARAFAVLFLLVMLTSSAAGGLVYVVRGGDVARRLR